MISESFSLQQIIYNISGILNSLKRMKEFVQPSNKPNVFERLTSKKEPSAVEGTQKPKSKYDGQSTLSSHKTITHKSSLKMSQKEIQKLDLSIDRYQFLVFPIDYAEYGLILEIKSQTENQCTINLDYNRYDIMVNELQHHFAMPIMPLEIKHIKLILPISWGNLRILIQRTKCKLKKSNILINRVMDFVTEKQIVTVDPFKDIEQSQIRRKRMLLKDLPEFKVGKCRTEASTILNDSVDSIKQLPLFQQKPECRTLESKFSSQSKTSDLRNKEVKSSICKPLTPKSRIQMTNINKLQNKLNEEQSTQDQETPSLILISPTKTRAQQNKLMPKYQIKNSLRNMTELRKTKQVQFPRRFL